MLDVSRLDPTIRCLSKALDGLSVRQQVTSNNIANVDTPGFKGGEVSFEARLRQSLGPDGQELLKTTHPAHFLSAEDASQTTDVVVTQAKNTTLRNDGNNVDIEKEMAKLAETTILYTALSQQMSAKLALLKSIISEGRR